MPPARSIVVCPLDALDAVIAQHHPAHVISIGSPDAKPPALDVPHHAIVTHHDVVDETHPRADLVHPAPEHARAVVDAALAWDRAAPLVIHCRFGVSRSPAAAVIALAALNPKRDEAEIARALRRAAPFAKPNIRLVAAADGVLERGGRLVAAVRAVGRGAFTSTGTAFALPA